MKKRKREVNLTFYGWIDEIGQQTIAEKLGIRPRTVSHWRTGRNHPKVLHMRAIRKLSGGRVTYDMIVDSGV